MFVALAVTQGAIAVKKALEQIDGSRIQDHLGELVRGTVEVPAAWLY